MYSLQYPDKDCKKFMKDQNYQDEVDLLVRDDQKKPILLST